jgi:hypothetical protein
MKIIPYFTLLFVLFIGCRSDEAINGTNASLAQENPYLLTNDDFNSELASILKQSTDSALSASEKAGLTFMREEEKLARDVYTKMYQKYNSRIFLNISKSEQRHTDAIKYLLNFYNLPDPAFNTPPGVFVNADLQSLYNELIIRGNVSLLEALKVGRDIEIIDIADLEEQLTNVVTHLNIKRVYQNLKGASEQHLRAFNWQIQNN